MEILEQSPPTLKPKIDNLKAENADFIHNILPNRKKATYHASYRNFLLTYGLLGALAGQLLSLVLQAPWPLSPLTLFFIGLAYAYHKVHYSLGDLTDWQIALLEGREIITPFNITQVEPDSYDVLLGSKYARIGVGGVEEYIEADEIIIKPGECLLAHTIESFSFPDNLKGTLQGKSSWARLSLFVECAGLFDKGFKGTAVLELYNASPNSILLKRGDKIAQMSFHRTLPASIPYGDKLRGSHYQKQEGAQISWLTKKKRILQ
jgi:dCTP deaminase